jgi:cytidine deaminase
MSKERELFNAAIKVRKNAYAPYSNFLVGAALRSSSGKIYIGCNVENIAYPEGTCAEAGAIASMIAAGDTEIKELTVVADSPKPVAPCGGCRQKISEFANGSTGISLATTSGVISSTSLEELLPGAFDQSFMEL